MTYRNGERGEWTKDCDCENCPGVFWMPSHFGPITFADYEIQQMFRRLWEPLIRKQLEPSPLLRLMGMEE